MLIKLVEKFFNVNFASRLTLTIIQRDFYSDQYCFAEGFYHQLDEQHVELTIDSGHGHNIVLLLTQSDIENRLNVSVKEITYFGEHLNIVGLRKYGFYDDEEIAHYVDASKRIKYAYFKTHAKRYAQTVSTTAMTNNFVKYICHTINIDIRKLYKTGLSEEALYKKSKHEHALIDTKTLFNIMKVDLREKNPVEQEIYEAIDK